MDRNGDGGVTFEELHEGELEAIDDDDRRDMEPPGNGGDVVKVEVDLVIYCDIL